MQGTYQGAADMERVTARLDKGIKTKLGSNLQTVLEGLRRDMIKAAENLEFEEAARLRDELRRLEAVDLAVHDDPLARQSAIEEAVEENGARPRSNTGKPGTRAYKGKRRGR
jgi:excinuclease ABC subunit B